MFKRNKITIFSIIFLIFGGCCSTYLYFFKTEKKEVLEKSEVDVFEKSEEKKKNQELSIDNEKELISDVEKDKRESIIFLLISEMITILFFSFFQFNDYHDEIIANKEKNYEGYPVYLSYHLDTIPYELNPFSYCRNKDNDNIDKKATRSSLFDRRRNPFGIRIMKGAREFLFTYKASMFTRLVRYCYVSHNQCFLLLEIFLPFLFAFFNRKKKGYLKRLKDIFLNKIYFRSWKAFILWYFLDVIIFHLIIHYLLIHRLANIAAVYFFGEKDKIEEAHRQLKETANQDPDIEEFKWSTFFRIFRLIFLI